MTICKKNAQKSNKNIFIVYSTFAHSLTKSAHFRMKMTIRKSSSLSLSTFLIFHSLKQQHSTTHHDNQSMKKNILKKNVCVCVYVSMFKEEGWNGMSAGGTG